jgi:hypothetical protein
LVGRAERAQSALERRSQLNPARNVLLPDQRVEARHPHVVEPAEARAEAGSERLVWRVAMREHQGIGRQQTIVRRNEA